MNGKHKLLVAGDYGASDESDSESAQSIQKPSMTDTSNTTYSNIPQKTNVSQGKLVILLNRNFLK